MNWTVIIAVILLGVTFLTLIVGKFIKEGMR